MKAPETSELDHEEQPVLREVGPKNETPEQAQDGTVVYSTCDRYGHESLLSLESKETDAVHS